MMKYFKKVMLLICLMLALSVNACAYLDPSVMTYTVQVVAGLIVAVSAVVSVYWRKAKRKVQKKMGIDESAKKTIEDDVVEVKKGDGEK